MKWWRGLEAGALVLVGLALVVWRVAIMIIERAPAGAALTAPTCAVALDPAYAGRAARARASDVAMLSERRIPGLSVAVGVSGRIVWSEGVGYADRERGVPACADAESLTTTRYESAYASLDRFRDDLLLFPPDSRASYSSYGFVLLSAAMERATGLDFPALPHREVSRPLGLERTEAAQAGVTTGGRASFYDHVTPYSMDGQVHPSPDIDLSGKWAGGGLLSTAEDLVIFGNAHIKPYN